MPDGLAPIGRAVAGGLAAVVIGAIGWAALARGGGAPPPPELSMPRAAAERGGTASSSPSTDDAPAAMVFAHVAGAVARPGLYRLGGSPRVADAIDAAGGLTPAADLNAINLAAPVADGERVYVPRLGEPPPPIATGGAGGGGGGGTAMSAGSGPLDLNAATAEQLDSLPGVGPSTAAAIVAYRQEHGRFRSVDELLEVRGIGQAKLGDLRPRVRVR
jgi:competence protein ComEA